MERKSRNTRQKELLTEEIKKLSSFFTADDLLSNANKRDGNIGIATVYRFLADLVKKRSIHSYTCNRKSLYSLKEGSHCHFICEKCGKTEHIHVKSLDFIKNQINGSMCHFQIDVVGICERCNVL